MRLRPKQLLDENGLWHLRRKFNMYLIVVAYPLNRLIELKNELFLQIKSNQLFCLIQTIEKNGLMHLRRKGVLFRFLKGHKHSSRFPLSTKLTESLTTSNSGIFCLISLKVSV